MSADTTLVKGNKGWAEQLHCMPVRAHSPRPSTHANSICSTLPGVVPLDRPGDCKRLAGLCGCADGQAGCQGTQQELKGRQKGDRS
eukprot:1130654-Pelagomonas_calceolata.AAC.1